MSKQSPSSSSADQGSPTGLRQGDKLGKYTIVQQIGAGGMAIVWKGHDPVLDRYVAIKEFSTAALDLQGQDLASRFRSEAEMQKKVARNNPHLVQVIDFVDEDRGLFIIMEYIAGQSLEQMLARTPAPIEQRQALGIVGAAALALGAIHKQDIVHRDLKPSNILLPEDGGLKVSDFGIAQIMGQQEAMAVGSVRYMAPELFREEMVDGRADIYSLGMIAYEMLAGREKFNEAFKVVLRDTRNQPLRWMKWHTNPRAKAPPLSQINPSVSQGLSDLVARMMEKDVQSRVASSQELLEAMRRMLSPNAQAKVAATAAAGDAIAPEVSANPTAALPKASKLPYILAAILLVQVAGIAGVFYYQHAKEQAAITERLNAGQERLVKAAEAYKAGDYLAAQALYEEVKDQWADTSSLRRGGEAGILLTEARMDIDAGNYNDALGKIAAAREMGVFKTSTLDNLRQEAQSRSSFAGEVQAINDMMDKNDLGMAATRLERLNGTTQQERDILQVISQRLVTLQANARDARAIADAKKEREAKGLDEGITYLEAQLATRPSEAVRALLDEWKQDRQYRSLIAEARKLENEGKIDQAISTLNRAQEIRTEGGNTRQIRTLKIRSLLAKADQLEKNNNNAAAADVYTEVLGLDKDHGQAKAALARIDVSKRREGFVRAAQSAMGRRDYDQAIQQYQNALELASDDATRAGLAAARTQQAITLGRAAIEDNKLDDARKHIQSALQLDGENAQAKELLTQIDTREQYLKFLTAGDQLREQGKFAEAQHEFLRAQRVARTPQVQKRLQDTEIQQMLSQARYYVSKEEWRSARAMLLTLLDKRPNEEAAKLLEEVNKQLPAMTEEENVN